MQTLLPFGLILSSFDKVRPHFVLFTRFVQFIYSIVDSFCCVREFEHLASLAESKKRSWFEFLSLTKWWSDSLAMGSASSRAKYASIWWRFHELCVSSKLRSYTFWVLASFCYLAQGPSEGVGGSCGCTRRPTPMELLVLSPTNLHPASVFPRVSFLGLRFKEEAACGLFLTSQGRRFSIGHKALGFSFTSIRDSLSPRTTSRNQSLRGSRNLLLRRQSICGRAWALSWVRPCQASTNIPTIQGILQSFLQSMKDGAQFHRTSLRCRFCPWSPGPVDRASNEGTMNKDVDLSVNFLDAEMGTNGLHFRLQYWWRAMGRRNGYLQFGG